jgi:hypothetical protein
MLIFQPSLISELCTQHISADFQLGLILPNANLISRTQARVIHACVHLNLVIGNNFPKVTKEK